MPYTNVFRFKGSGLMAFKLRVMGRVLSGVRDALGGLRLRLVLLVACGILPLILLVGDIHESQRQEELRDARESVLLLARNGAHQQAELLSNVRNLLNVLTSIPAIRNHETAVCGQILADIIRLQPGLTNLWTARADGGVSCSDDPAGLHLNMSSRRYFRDALSSNEFVVSNYIIGRLSGRPVLATALAFGADRGEDVGVVFASVDINWLYHLAEEETRGQGIALVLIDGEGTLLAHTPPLPADPYPHFT
jgi:hypothetical protein